MKRKPASSLRVLLPALCSGALISSAAIAQNQSVLLEEVLVTATKKAKAEELQDVAISATAYSEAQLEVLQMRDLQSLSYNMPNVAMEDIGTTKGVANFSFRGLGVNSSIPTIDPTVGVFVDGVYMGTNAGVVFDQFDLDGIEVLRGPQGILFGRNVTGGAVIMRTKNPTQEFEGSAKVSYESGDNKTVAVSLTGPIIDDKLLGKLAVYYNNDGGYHENEANGNDNFGKSDMTLIRGGLTILHGGDGNAETTIKIEHGSNDGDGPASQNHGLYDRDSFDFAIDEEGYFDNEWTGGSITYTRDIGEGTLTNIAGAKGMKSRAVSDIDATPNHIFHAPSYLKTEQYSNELRYNIRLSDMVDLTTGLYYFQQDIDYIEVRSLFGGTTIVGGGGTQEQTTSGAFIAADWNLTEAVTLTTGVRYTEEEKKGQVASLSPGGNCTVEKKKCDNFNLEETKDWSNVSPKVALQWFLNESTQVYASYSKGFRSGGFNLRNDPAGAPEPFEEEEQDSYEIGMKLDAYDGQLRVNVALFQNEITDMQRELNTAGALGVRQVIVNSADATITGGEFEILTALGDHFVLGLNGGYLDGDYDKISEDISFDPNDPSSGPQGTIDSRDYALELPRLAKVTYGANLTWQNNISDGANLLARVSFNHRDQVAYTDNNSGVLNAADMVDASISLNTKEDVTYTLYGKNLKDEVTHGGDTQLPFVAPFGGVGASFAPLNKGRVYGAEVRVNF